MKIAALVLMTFGASLMLGSCASQQKESTAKVYRFGVKRLYTANLSYRASVSRSPAGEGVHGNDKVSIKEDLAKLSGIALISEQMKLMQKFDAGMGKLKKVLAKEVYDSLIKRMKALDAAGEKTSAGTEFLKAYMKQFPNEKLETEALMQRIDAINEHIEKSTDEGELLTLDQMVKDLEPHFQKLAKGIPLGEHPTLDELGDFLEAYYAKLSAKLDRENVDVGIAFGLGLYSLGNLPEVDYDEAAGNLEKYQAQFTQVMTRYFEKFGKKYKLDNYFVPSLTNFLITEGIK